MHKILKLSSIIFKNNYYSDSQNKDNIFMGGGDSNGSQIAHKVLVYRLQSLPSPLNQEASFQVNMYIEAFL